ncbi:hypothetical protein Hanom_Chr16g01468401 [Helianthus anomalus]
MCIYSTPGPDIDETQRGLDKTTLGQTLGQKKPNGRRNKSVSSKTMTKQDEIGISLFRRYVFDETQSVSSKASKCKLFAANTQQTATHINTYILTEIPFMQYALFVLSLYTKWRQKSRTQADRRISDLVDGKYRLDK